MSIWVKFSILYLRIKLNILFSWRHNYIGWKWYHLLHQSMPLILTIRYCTSMLLQTSSICRCVASLGWVVIRISSNCCPTPGIPLAVCKYTVSNWRMKLWEVGDVWPFTSCNIYNRDIWRQSNCNYYNIKELRHWVRATISKTMSGMGFAISWKILYLYYYISLISVLCVLFSDL